MTFSLLLLLLIGSLTILSGWHNFPHYDYYLHLHHRHVEGKGVHNGRLFSQKEPDIPNPFILNRTNSTKLSSAVNEPNLRELSEMERAISQIEAESIIGSAAMDFQQPQVVKSPLRIEEILFPNQTDSKEFFNSMNDLLTKYGFSFVNGSLEIIDSDYSRVTESESLSFPLTPKSADFVLTKGLHDTSSTNKNFRTSSDPSDPSWTPSEDRSSSVVDTTLVELSSVTEDDQTSIIKAASSPFYSSVSDLVKREKASTQITSRNEGNKVPLSDYEENLQLIKQYYVLKKQKSLVRPVPLETGIFKSAQKIKEWNQKITDHISPNLYLTATTFQPDGEKGSTLFIHNEGILFQSWEDYINHELIPALLRTKHIDHRIDVTKTFKSLSWKDLPVYQQTIDYQFLLNNVTSIIFILNDQSTFQYKKGSFLQPSLSLQGKDDDLMMFASQEALQRLLDAINNEQKEQNLRLEKDENENRKKTNSIAPASNHRPKNKIQMTVVKLSSLLGSNSAGNGGEGATANAIGSLFSWTNPSFEGRFFQRSQTIENQLLYFFKEYQYPYTVLNTGYLLHSDQAVPIESDKIANRRSADESFLQSEEISKPSTKLQTDGPVSRKRSPIAFFYHDNTYLLKRYHSTNGPFFTRSRDLIDSIARNVYYPHGNNTAMHVASDLTADDGSATKMTQEQWDDEFTKFIGPEILRVPLLHCKYVPELLFFLYYQVKEELLSPSLGLITPIEVVKTYYGLQIRFKPLTSNYDDVFNFKQLKKQEKESISTTSTRPKQSRYISPEEERRLELLQKQKEEEINGIKTSQDEKVAKKKEKIVYDGGLDIIIEDEPYYRLRIRRCLLQKSTVIKEESEKLIVSTIKKAFARLENDYRILKDERK